MIIIASANQYFPDSSPLAKPFNGVEIIEGSSVHGCSRVVLRGSRLALKAHVIGLESTPLTRFVEYCLNSYDDDKLFISALWAKASPELKQKIMLDQ